MMLLVSAMTMMVIVTVWQSMRYSRRYVARRRLVRSFITSSVTVSYQTLDDLMVNMRIIPEVPPWFALSTRRAGLEIEAQKLWSIWLLGGSFLLLVSLILAGIGMAIVVSVVVIATPMALLWAMRERVDQMCATGLPVMLESVARSMRSGASLRQALEESLQSSRGPLREDLQRLVDDLLGGVALGEALERWESRRPLPGVRLSVAALGLGAETGGAHAQALDGVGETLRSELGIAEEIKALSSQARYSGLVIAVAPLIFSVLAAASDSSTAEFLFRTPIGWICLTIGLSLDLVAALWMQRLARVKL